MQYGNLTHTQQKIFDEKQASGIRKPTFAVWLEGFGNTTGKTIAIDAESAIESLKGRGSVNIGRAILTVNNENRYFSGIRTNAKIKIWAGFSQLNIPIFSGVVHSVKPVGSTNEVIINCQDYMGLFSEMIVKGSQYPNDSPKTIIEGICSHIFALSNIPSTEETTSSYDTPTFDEVRTTTALEDICDSIFHVAYFDEEGTLQLVEREFVRPTNWKFSDNNVIECEFLTSGEIINDIVIEYQEDFYVSYSDQVSIDRYRRRTRSLRNNMFNSVEVSRKYQGSSSAVLNYGLEGFKFTSSENATLIDCLHVKMRGDSAHGYITAKIYSDSGGFPSTLLGESQLKSADNLSTNYVNEVFYFKTPIRISPSTDYWCIMDTSSVDTGAVYVQVSRSPSTAKHAYYSDGSWHTEDNKQILHHIRGSVQALRVAQDIVRLYKEPHERIKITAPAVPQLQLMDGVRVDIKRLGLCGHYCIERRRHLLTPQGYITIDTLRRIC